MSTVRDGVVVDIESGCSVPLTESTNAVLDDVFVELHSPSKPDIDLDPFDP